MSFLNPFVMKRVVSSIVPSLLSCVLFYIGVLYYGLLGGIGFMVVGLLLGYFICLLLLRNPFTSMLEGRGILVLNVDSTGVIRPFVVSVQSPFIVGRLGGKNVKDGFDRNAVYNMAAPVDFSKKVLGKKCKSGATWTEGGGLRIELDELELNKARFALFHYPVLLYNEQVGSMITKDFLADQEKVAFAEHGVLYLNRKMEELTSVVRDFGRYVVELTRPQGGSIFGKWWVWVIVGVLVIFLILMFAPSVINAMGATINSGGDAVSGAVTVR